MSQEKKITREKFFDFEIFGSNSVLKHSESIPTKKNFDQIFLTLSFFHYFGLLGRKTRVCAKKIYTGKNFRFRDFRFKIEKRLSPRKKIYTGKIFWFQDFWFKIRFETFWFDSDQNNFFDQNFSTLSFFHYFWPFGRKTTKSEQKKITWEKIFDFEIFGLKYVLKHSESIPTKKFWWPKFLNLVIFSPGTGLYKWWWIWGSGSGSSSRRHLRLW